jgi:hypothetical protein
MNLRHAAALALAGWYLMVPPRLSHSPKGGQIAPLSRWTIGCTFESEKACDAERSDPSKIAPPVGSYRGLPPEQVYDAQCIVSDDPRLAK